MMSFRLADGFFPPTVAAQAVKLRVVYLDAGKGSWELAYATNAGEKTARKVELSGSGEWREVSLTLADAVWDHRLGGGGDLALRHAGGADTTFHLIELERQ
jgi:hypothetical protein